MKSPFVPFPRTRGPVKLLLYGDPGTLKTRRALGFPGPRFMVDLEKGADEYGDLVSDGDQYLACQSAEALSSALDYLDGLPAGAVGTLIVDPITVVWERAPRPGTRSGCPRRRRSRRRRRSSTRACGPG
jgi:hypothetical protein